MKSILMNCLLGIVFIVADVLLIYISYNAWGGPDGYTIAFLTTLVVIVSVIGIVAMIMGDKFLYMIYGEPSNRNPW